MLVSSIRSRSAQISKFPVDFYCAGCYTVVRKITFIKDHLIFSVQIALFKIILSKSSITASVSQYACGLSHNPFLSENGCLVYSRSIRFIIIILYSDSPLSHCFSFLRVLQFIYRLVFSILLSKKWGNCKAAKNPASSEAAVFTGSLDFTNAF